MAVAPSFRVLFSRKFVTCVNNKKRRYADYKSTRVGIRSNYNSNASGNKSLVE